MPYDRRYGFVNCVMDGGTGRAVGGDRPRYGMSGLGEHPWVASGQCQKFKNLVTIYQRLSQKKDKSKETRENAAKLAQQHQRNYQQCVAAKQAKPAPTPVTPVTPVTPATPVPWVPYPGGGGGGGGGTWLVPAVPEDFIPIEGGPACPYGGQVYQQTNTGQLFCFDGSGQRVYYGTAGWPARTTFDYVPHGALTSQGYPIYRVTATGQLFYFDPTTGQRVYQNANGTWGTQTTIPGTPLTPVPYIQMPGDTGTPAYDESGQLVPYGQEAFTTLVPYGQQPAATGVPAAAAPIPWAQMPGTGPAAGTVNEKDLIASQGPTEYEDDWGAMQVIELVFPKSSAQSVMTPSGQGVMPGGTMPIEDFTSAYVLEGGQW